MPRVKRGTTKTKKRERLLKHTKGFMWGRKSKKSSATEALLHAWSHMFQDRKAKKRTFRQLWNVKINAALRQEGLTYSRFIKMLKDHNVELDRKVMADMAEHHPESFKALIQQVSESTK